MLDLKCVKKSYGHAIRECCEEKYDNNRKCTVPLNGKGNKFLILKADAIENSKPMCDFIIFRLGMRSKPILIEIKGKSFNVGHAKHQLINGSKLAQIIAEECSDSWIPNTYYLVIVCREWDPIIYRMIVNDFIKLAGIKHRVYTGKCSEKLRINPQQRG